MGARVTVKRLTGSIGAEVNGVILNESLDDATFAAIHQAFLDHNMLVFRGQHLDPAAQTAFASRWGKAFHAPYLKPLEVPGHPEVMAQSNLGKANSYTTEVWHSDQSFMPAPPAHSILAAQVLPDAGGDTMFANQYIAYETLSEGIKRLLRELRAWHGGAKLANLLVGGVNSVPAQSHPVVRTHPETGRKALFVNRLYTYCIDGWTEAESRGLLDFLFEQSRPEFTYRHQWAPGDVIMWDNRCTLHYAVHDYGEVARLMHRVTVAGDIPC